MAQKINAKYMETNLKKGWTMNDFCQDLGIDEEKFKQLLGKFFSARVKASYKKRMEANSKISSKKQIHKPMVEETDTCEGQQIDTQTTVLQALKEQEILIRDYIFDSEISLRGLNREKRICKKRLLGSQNHLKQILKKLEEEKARIDSSINRLLQINLESEVFNSEISKAQCELTRVREKINELNTITLFCEADGQILCDDMAIPENLDFEIILQDLMNVQLLEELTLKELKFIARLKAIKEYLTNETDRNVEIKFEKESNISVAIGLLEES